MKISSETLALLKNFRDLNSNILIKNGNTIKTLTPAKNVMAAATVDETFPVEFGIWDLTSFLGTISLFDDPDFEFLDTNVLVRGSGGSQVRYLYSAPSLLTVPTKDVNMPSSVVSFDLSEKNLNDLKKASAVLNLPDLSIQCSGGEISAVVTDNKNATSNSYSVVVGEGEEGHKFNFDFKIENLRLFSGDYEVEIAEKVVSHFVNKNIDLEYWVALESSSSFSMTSTAGAM